MDEEKIKECLETQLAEIEMLQSMFYKDGEIQFNDYCIIADMKEFVDGKTKMIPPYLDLTLNVNVDQINFNLCVTLPTEYPTIEPDIYVRVNKQSREQQYILNNKLIEYVKQIDRGDTCIYSIITWLQENVSLYIDETSELKPPAQVKIEKTSNILARFWIYSHHIYSKTKRREILNLADEYSLTGFCLPGKPGVICIEGFESDCNSWWMLIRSMTWKRIVCKYTEQIQTDDVDKLRKFPKFEELSFHCEGNRGNHMSMSGLLSYLEQHQCGEMFNQIFGFESKNI